MMLFGLLKKRMKGKGKSSNNSSNSGQNPGMHLLAAILLCYMEVDSAAYEPQDSILRLNFVIDGQLSREELQHIGNLLNDSVQTYHLFEDGREVHLGAEAEVQDDCVMLHVLRVLPTVTRGELDLIADTLCDQYKDRLRIAPHMRGVGQEHIDEASAMLDQLLSYTQHVHINDHLVGMREQDEVVVYNSNRTKTDTSQSQN